MRRWEENIKIYLKQMKCDYVSCIHLVQDRDQWRALVNAVMNLWIPYKADKFSDQLSDY